MPEHNTISSYTIPVDIDNVSLIHSPLLQLCHELTSEHAHCQHIHLHVYNVHYDSVIECIIHVQYNYCNKLEFQRTHTRCILSMHFSSEYCMCSGFPD